MARRIPSNITNHVGCVRAKRQTHQGDVLSGEPRCVRAYRLDAPYDTGTDVPRTTTCSIAPPPISSLPTNAMSFGCCGKSNARSLKSNTKRLQSPLTQRIEFPCWIDATNLLAPFLTSCINKLPRERNAVDNKALNLTRCCRVGFLVESVSSARRHRAGSLDRSLASEAGSRNPVHTGASNEQ